LPFFQITERVAGHGDAGFSLHRGEFIAALQNQIDLGANVVTPKVQGRTRTRVAAILQKFVHYHGLKQCTAKRVVLHLTRCLNTQKRASQAHICHIELGTLGRLVGQQVSHQGCLAQLAGRIVLDYRAE